ncbi:hypothetical protein HNQ07_004793 [Deinococcus metalli]|uniref:Uncharacterized protein n=2 Tax=Deinococcus metalli TaxID=1141878 RepID=A0A7W8NTM8_9DEIO|nr:hypothetical protein [Deinococcus metalli]
MIHGPIPLYLIEAPMRGTGKTLLAQILALVTLGNEVGTMVQPANDGEFEKRVTSSLLGGARIILLDNVHTLKGEARSEFDVPLPQGFVTDHDADLEQ